MNTEFVTLQLKRGEALEFFKGLMAVNLIENEIRSHKGFESADFIGSMERLRLVLGLSEQDFKNITDELAEDLWEYAWYAYTSEWAWYRARQEASKVKKSRSREVERSRSRKSGRVERDGGRKPEVSESELAERFYEEKFDHYVAEINIKT